eukprot:gene6552-7555_t
MAEEQAPADLALALKTHARLFDHLRRRQVAIHALRAYHADNATMLQHLEVCLEDGINYKVNVACSRSGFTPIFAACLHGDPTAVKMLLAFGADAVAEYRACPALVLTSEDGGMICAYHVAMGDRFWGQVAL